MDFNLSFSEFGYESMGKPGQIITDITLAMSQFSFVIPYIVFISQNMQLILKENLDLQADIWVFGLICFLILAPLCWVRKISTFSDYHILADISILLVLVIVVSFGILAAFNDGIHASEVKIVNTHSFLSFFGTAVYIFEGIGVVLPLYEITEQP